MKRLYQNILMAFVVIAAVVCLNILAANFATQFDFTFDQRYTLAPATKKLLAGLNDPVTVKAYFTGNLPQPYNTVSQYTQDLLNSYYSASKGLVRYQFIDPMEQIDEELAEGVSSEPTRDIFGRLVRPETHLEQELHSKGIMPVTIRVNDNDKLEERRAYLGLEILYGDQSEVIQLVQDVNKLEYQITSLLIKMHKDSIPKIAFLSGHGELGAKNGLQNFVEQLHGLYEVVDLDLSTITEAIPEDIQALAVIGPRSALNDHELELLDKYIMSGKGVAFLLDSLDVDIQEFTSKPINHGLDKLLNAYGITVEQGIIGDAQGASLGIEQRQGFLTIKQPVKYFFMPLLMRYPAESVISSGLGPIAMAYVSPISVENSKLTTQILAQSSSEAWLEKGEQPDLSPMQDWNSRDINFNREPFTMALAAEGLFKSPYEHGQKENRLAVFGNSYFLNDDFLQPSGVAMMINTLDWLRGQDDLLSMRNRGLSFSLLNQDIPAAQRNIIKYFNIFGGTFVLIGLGLVIKMRRERKRRALNKLSR